MKPERWLLPVVWLSLGIAMNASANPLQTDTRNPADPAAEEAAAEPSGADGAERTIVVTATAFNSLSGQTDEDPTTAAWGDDLTPGMKAIAVSRDLIPLGLEHRTTVSIEGLPGEYRVLDKMNQRWSKRIDIYMGDDRDAAIDFGRQQVRIRW